MTAAVFAAIAVAAVVIVGWALWRQRVERRRQQLDALLATQHRAGLDLVSPLHARLPDPLLDELAPAMRSFVERVDFVGCNGLAVTDDMRRLVATYAALLTRRVGIGAYDRLYSVLIYPDEFVVEQRYEDEDTGLVTEAEEVLSGQTIDTDRVIISWRDVVAADADSPYDVLAHELAHYLDHALDGSLTHGAAQDDWHATLAQEQRALQDALDRDEPTLLDAYGADDPAEFFCVATEAFLQAPQEFERLHPALYAQLSRFYGLDPARWPARARA
ncbi:MAG: M90 family metallopeptidase [Steroidobacteraceae bacterium]